MQLLRAAFLIACLAAAYAPSGLLAATCGGTGQLPCGQCDISSNPQASPACSALVGFLAVTTSDPTYHFNAVRSDAGQSASVPIDAYIDSPSMELCRYVDNTSTSGQSIFVPFKSPPEWNAFYKHLPGFVSLSDCTRAMQDSISPDANCYNPVPAAQPVTLPYVRFPVPDTNPPQNPQQTIQVTFQCTDSAGKNPWQEVATAVYQGIDADNSQPNTANHSWTQTSLTYSANNSNGACRNAFTGTVTYYQGVTLQDEIYGYPPPEPNLCSSGPGGTADSLPVVYTLPTCPDGYCTRVPGPGGMCQDYCICSLLQWTCPASGGGTPAACQLIIHPAHIGCTEE